MFSGIIQKTAIIDNVSSQNDSLFIYIQLPKGWKLKQGESIAINGVCSTVKSMNKKVFVVEYMPETIKKTTVGKLKKGDNMNLEKSLKLNDVVHGHIVQGHIDTQGEIIDIKKVKKSKIIKIKMPKKFMRFITAKGSIAVDGVSLTVVDTGKNRFSVSLVSYTLENTILGKKKEGDCVNIETDMIAKYLDTLLQSYGKKKNH